jgi:hypothetical protein
LMGALQDQSVPYTLRRYQHVSGVNTRPAREHSSSSSGYEGVKTLISGDYALLPVMVPTN